MDLARRRGRDKRGEAPPGTVLAGLLGALALGVLATAVLGPLVLGVLRYRTSSTTLNQLVGADAAAMAVVVPLTVLAAVLAARRHRAAAPLASGVAAYVVYTWAQLVIGQEYLRLPGNVERFFPLLLTVFVLAEAVGVLAWRRMPEVLPRASVRLERTAGAVLLAVALFLVVGLHLPTILAAWSDPSSLTEYASSPTPFWLVKLMDLGIVVPAAVATGVGLLRGAAWARRVVYPLLTGYTCLGASVASMAVVMLVEQDPDASPALAAGFVGFALAFAVLTVALYRGLPRSQGPHEVARRGGLSSGPDARRRHRVGTRA
jgi:hypothetical protein